MTVVVAGLSSNNTITTIDFSSCDLDEAALYCVEQALVASPSMLASISSIRLPRIRSQEGFKSFLRNLASMTCIKEVAIRDSLDAEGKELLLVAVKKKKIRAFEWMGKERSCRCRNRLLFEAQSLVVKSWNVPQCQQAFGPCY
jgi:hypothetical protein